MRFSTQKSLEYEPNLSGLGCEPAKTKPQLQKPKQQGSPLLSHYKVSRDAGMLLNTCATKSRNTLPRNAIQFG